MKKNTKRVLALIAATVMSCTMVTGFANTASITKVEVLNTDGTAVLWSYEGAALTDATINANASNLVKVYTQITDGAETPAPVSAIESTFLSHLSGASELNNTNIMFVDQKTTGEDGTAVYTFRPRATSGENFVNGQVYVAKTGGEGVAAADEKSYTVGTVAINWTIAATNNNVEIGATDAIVYNILLPANAVAMPAAVTVKIDGTAIETYTYDATNKTLSITGYNSANESTEPVTHAVTVEASGYTTLSTNYVVKAKEVVVDPIVPGDEEKVEEGVKDSLGTSVNPTVVGDTGTVELSSGSIAGTGTSYNVTYSLVGASEAASINDNVVTYDFTKMGDGVIAETVTVKASVGSKESTKKFHFIKPSVKLAFGNINAATDNGGKVDVFASQEGVASVTDDDVTYIRAQVLNIVYNQEKKDGAAQWKETLDYDKDDKVSIGEYYIIKRMFDEADADPVHDVYNVENINKNRKNAQ